MKKTIFLLLTSITIITASILTGCSNPNLPGGGMSGTNDNGTVRFSWSSQVGGRSSSGRNVLSRANTIQDAARVVISIEAADGTAIYSQKQLSLFNFNGSFISEPLALKVGNYKLTEYLVLNQAGTVIYATPKEGSPKAHLVADPLPINFAVTKDNTTKVIPEVVDTTAVNPADFGYATFSFTEAKVFNFLVSVMVYDASTDNFVLTNATMDLTTDAKAYSFNLAPVTNNIAVNEMSGTYTLTISKTGYEEYRASYTNAEMKGFLQNPLVVVLSEKQGPANSVITFADPNLETAVRQAISKPTGDIYTNDVAALTNLNANNKNISNLSGIEQLTSLTYLQLINNSISDLSTLSSLKNLNVLHLNGNSINEINHLSALTNLKVLYLNSNSIKDINHLSALINLRELDLSQNSISDIRPLSAMTNLRSLYLNGNSINDFNTLSSLTSLENLALSNNSISDLTSLTSLASLTNLSVLSLTENSINDITPLSSFTSLTYLYLQNNKISNIIPLSSMEKLTIINLHGNSISDISPLAVLTSLHTLDLRQNSITDITPLVNNAEINSNDKVFLSGNPLSVTAKNTHIPALKARGVTVTF